jgi:glycosyl transferase family 87
VTARAAGMLAFAAVMVSGLAHLALQYLPRPWSVLGHIDIAQLLDATPIFSTHWPYWTFPFEYHPVIGWGSAVISYLTGELVVLVVVWLAIMALAARAAAMLLAQRVGPRRAIVFWSLAPQLLLFSGQNFDALAVLTIVYASAALRADRPVRAGISLAVGAATKLFPIVALPPYLVALWRAGARRAAFLFAVATCVALAVIDGPAIVAPFSLLSYGVTPYAVPTWNVDSVWLPVAMLLDLFVRPDRAAPIISVLSLGGLIATYAWLVLRPALRRGADAERLAWVATGLLVFWTRLRSPQYAIWLLPIFALYVPEARLLLFMFIGDAVTYVSVFALRGTSRDVLAPEAVPFYMAILAGVLIRQVAVARLLLRARAR